MLIEEYFSGLIAVELSGENYEISNSYSTDLDKITYRSFLPKGDNKIQGKIMLLGGVSVCEFISYKSNGRFVIKFVDLTKNLGNIMSTSWKEFYENFEVKNKDNSVRMSFARKKDNSEIRVVGNESQIRKEVDKFISALWENAPFIKKVI